MVSEVSRKKPITRRQRVERAEAIVLRCPGVLPGFLASHRTGIGETRHSPRTDQAKQVVADQVASYGPRGRVEGGAYQSESLPIVVEHLRRISSQKCNHCPDKGAVVYAAYLNVDDGEIVYRLCRVIRSGRIWATIKFFDDGRTRHRVDFACLYEILAR